jgi:putative acetyltransferase
MTYTIRALAEADIPAIVSMRNMPKVRWGTLRIPFEGLGQYRAMLAARPAAERISLVACADGEVVGEAGLYRVGAARQAHVARLGIMVHDDWQGKGVGTALFTALIDLADNWLGLRRLELGVFADNRPAIALYQKLGFEVEGRLRMEAFRDGAFVDGLIMARLRGHFEPGSAAPPPAPPAPPGPFILRAAEPEDAADISEVMNQPGVRYGTLRMPFSTEGDSQRFVSLTESTTRSIVAEAAGKAVGIGMLIPGKGARAHVGDLALMSVHDAYQGRGIGAEILKALLDIADIWLNLKRVELSVFADNAPAIAVYEKACFVRESYLRADAFRAGGFADAVGMARFNLG